MQFDLANCTTLHWENLDLGVHSSNWLSEAAVGLCIHSLYIWLCWRRLVQKYTMKIICCLTVLGDAYVILVSAIHFLWWSCHSVFCPWAWTWSQKNSEISRKTNVTQVCCLLELLHAVHSWHIFKHFSNWLPSFLDWCVAPSSFMLYRVCGIVATVGSSISQLSSTLLLLVSDLLNHSITCDSCDCGTW